MTTQETTRELPGLAELKQHARASWAAGDFPAVAKMQLWDVGERLVRRVGIGRGEDVLDVACGTGNAALRAAAAGGKVVGVDLTPELFPAGRALAAEAGVEVEWVEGDAEELPWADESFDVVLSTFGVMFTPRHAVAARELVRVLRPGGRFGCTSWTPEGLQGTFFRMLGSYAPPAPPFVQPPLLWGDESHVRELFAGAGVTLEFARETVPLAPFDSPEEAVDWTATYFGPLMMLRGMLEQRGEWDALRSKLVSIYVSGAPAEYLVVQGTRDER
ncbi:class I SAM-dependent methyltransferase [Kribbella sp. NPDC004536]|uniref:class I SAM-dependent methyltransferase n=1 Tax=Kribbella sp. NPDC004536 TaxID=3364106 RepID=UPI0036B79FBE